VVNDLRSDNVKAALDTFGGKGLLHIEQDSQNAREQLVKHWQAYTEANPDKQTVYSAPKLPLLCFKITMRSRKTFHLSDKSLPVRFFTAYVLGWF
jgi:hypothetical protein|tara:strand:+ start:441 stop:725 length:285 start_codon:yes stop_codon:yes gene_type:complete